MRFNSIVFTKSEEKIPQYFFHKLLNEKGKFYFLYDSVAFSERININELDKKKIFVFCSYGLKKRGYKFDDRFIISGLAYLSKFIEESDNLLII